MDECTPSIDSALWRIAELGARCAQRSARIDRRPMWEELEGLIADLGGELTAARHNEPAGAPDVRHLQQELKAAVRERDAARAARGAWQGRLRKVDAARAEAVTELAGSQDRVTDLESALEAAVGERDAAVAAREASLAASEDVISQLAARAEGRRPAAP